MNATIKLTDDQQQRLPRDADVVEVTDDLGRRFVLISQSAYDRMKMLLEAEEIDPSLYEAEEVELAELPPSSAEHPSSKSRRKSRSAARR